MFSLENKQFWRPTFEVSAFSIQHCWRAFARADAVLFLFLDKNISMLRAKINLRTSASPAAARGWYFLASISRNASVCAHASLFFHGTLRSRSEPARKCNPAFMCSAHSGGSRHVNTQTSLQVLVSCSLSLLCGVKCARSAGALLRASLRQQTADRHGQMT